jgi:sugar phosphate isomerase/epimerase
MNCGLSTSWQSAQITDGNKLLDTLGATGLKGLEIDYRVSRATLLQMWPRLRSGEFTVYSVHNYCPTPPGYEGHPHVAALFNPASLDAEERKLAIRYGLKSIQLAAELEARLVVFHLGVIELDFRMKELFDLHAAGGMNSPALKERLRELQTLRAGRVAPYLSSLLYTVAALHDEAHKLGVLIGVENRYRLSQIPIGDEFDLLFDEFDGGQLRYWHDVGHAEIFARLGINDHAGDFLERFKHRLAGMHIHDIDGFRDHLAPGMGSFDFKQLVPYLKEESLRIIEAHDPVTLAQLREGVEVLQEAGVL